MTKPVKFAYSIKFDAGHNASNFSIRPDGSFLITDKAGNPVAPASLSRATYYDRAKGPKYQTRNASIFGEASIGGLLELTKFDKIIVTDTNRHVIDDKPVAAACFIVGRFVLVSPTAVRFELIDPRLNTLELRGVGGNPEMLAILRICSDIAGHERPTRTAVITDSELGKHDQINARAEPIYGEHLLPSGFQLLYASSDTGTEAPNQLLKFCDRESSNFLDALQAGTAHKSDLFALAGHPGVTYRFISRSGLEIGNPTINFQKLDENSRIYIYGVPKKTPS
jgi:hypothetical protein